jgi:hypothetical protein
MPDKEPTKNQPSPRLYNRRGLDSFNSLVIAVSAILIYFIKNFLGIAETWRLDENISQHLDQFLIVIFIVAAFTFIYNNRYRWFDSHLSRLERALAKIINEESPPQSSVIWCANVRELVEQILQDDSPLMEVLDDLIHEYLNSKPNLAKEPNKSNDAKEAKEAKKVELLQLLVTIHSQIHLQPKRIQSSLLDETAIWAARGDKMSEQLESFQMKRALYQTFAASWPLRITLFLLLVALSLVGWKTLQLVKLGADARKFSENAVKDIKLAQSQLNNSRQDLENSQMEMMKLVNHSRESMVASQRSVQKAQENLAEATDKGVRVVSEAAQDGVKKLKQKLDEKSNALQSDITKLTNDHSKALNELAVDSSQTLTKLTKVYTISINDTGKGKIEALNSRFEQLDTEASGLLSNYQQTIDNVLTAKQTQLGTHLILKTTELNNKTTEIVGRLLVQEVNAGERINKVFDRVESSEQQRVEVFNDKLIQNEKKIIALVEKIQKLNEHIKQREEFSKVIINVADQIANKSNWSEKIAVLIEWRSLVLMCVAIFAFVSLVLSGIALIHVHRKKDAG